jgi:hypothetical protein
VGLVMKTQSSYLPDMGQKRAHRGANGCLRNQFFAPRKMSVRFKDGEVHMSVELSTEEGEDKACGMMADISAAVGGAISGTLGGLFQLIGVVACD